MYKRNWYSQIVFDEIRDADTPNFERARILCSKEKSIRVRLKEFTMGWPIDVFTESEYPILEYDDDGNLLPESTFRKSEGHPTKYYVDGKWLILREILKHPKMECTKQAFYDKLDKGYTVEEAMRKQRRKKNGK